MAWERDRVWSALLLTLMGAAGTSLGALMVVIHPKMKFERLGLLQGLAGGLMLSISMFDLFPQAAAEVGFGQANLWFFIGVLFFAAVVAVIPDPDSSQLKVEDDEEPQAKPASAAKPKKTAARTPKSKAKGSDSEGEGARTPRSSRSTAGKAQRRRSVSASRPPSEPGTPVAAAPLTPGGAAALLSKDARIAAKRRVLMSGLITALGIALHNFPEGVAVFLSSMKSHAMGLSVALAIALHNIPEGVAVALPVYFATGSRWKGFKYAFLSGLAEPLAVVVLALFFPSNLSKSLVEKLLAAVGGIMAFLSIHELLPLSIQHAGREAAVASLFVGMALMSGLLHVADNYLGHGHDHGHGHEHDHHH